MSRISFFSLTLCFISLIEHNTLHAQNRLNIVDAAATVTTTKAEEDTATTPTQTALLRPDSLRTRYHARLDAGYHTPRVHPYFRDEYRVIQDIRRLILFVDPYVLIGLEPMQEMLGIARLFPSDKQHEMIRVAVAGSVVNQISETVSRRLRRTKLRHVQWQLEKVTVGRSLRHVYLSGAYGVNVKSYAVHVPKLKLSYSKYATKYYGSEGFHFSPIKYAGFAYGWSGGKPVYGPRFNTPVGNAAVTYDEKYDVMFASYELRRSMSVIVRMLYVNYLKFPQANLWRAEIMLRR